MFKDSEENKGFFYVLQEETKIIYVDDDPILREFACVNLASEQASVTTAADGVDALAQLASLGPDIMILDLEMPRMDGFEVLARLREDEVWARLPVIVATGREDVIAIDRAFRLGATSFVVKPINWRLLSYQIRYVLRSGRSGTTPPPVGERRGDTELAAKLETLAAEGARFVMAALRRDPTLRSAATEFADAMERALASPVEARR